MATDKERIAGIEQRLDEVERALYILADMLAEDLPVAAIADGGEARAQASHAP